MKTLFVHPSPLMYSEVYLRLEPLGLELVAESAPAAGHQVRLLDLQVFRHRDFCRTVEEWKPEAIGFSLNYLASIPEVIDLAKAARQRLPDCFLFAGGLALPSPRRRFSRTLLAPSIVWCGGRAKELRLRCSKPPAIQAGCALCPAFALLPGTALPPAW
jgi:hypothetical protein